jgi:hypothetical protein
LDALPHCRRPYSRRDLAQWQKRLGPTIKAMVSITLHPAMAPNQWSLEPCAMVFSG